MPSYSFTVSVVSTPPIEVSGVNISYQEILNSFGAYFYLLEKVFIQAGSYAQANTPLQFNYYNSDGQKKIIVTNPALDPYGRQPALLVDLTDHDLLADGRLIATPLILPGSMVRYTWFTQRGFLSEMLNKYGPSNKERLRNV